MTVKLLIPGQREPAAPYAAAVRSAAPGAAAKAPTDLLDNVQVVHAFSLSPTARALKQQQPEALEIQDDDILEIEVEGGFTVWTSAARYQEQVALLQPEAISERGLSLSAIAQPSAAERGVKEWVTSALRVLRLKPDEIQGGTFSITNAGVYGAINSAPVINVPEVAIMGVHKIVERPVIRDGQIVARPMMNAAIGFDHRVVDGELAVKFLRRVCELLEKPELLWFYA